MASFKQRLHRRIAVNIDDRTSTVKLRKVIWMLNLNLSCAMLSACTKGTLALNIISKVSEHKDVEEILNSINGHKTIVFPLHNKGLGQTLRHAIQTLNPTIHHEVAALCYPFIRGDGSQKGNVVFPNISVNAKKYLLEIGTMVLEFFNGGGFVYLSGTLPDKIILTIGVTFIKMDLKGGKLSTYDVNYLCKIEEILKC